MKEETNSQWIQCNACREMVFRREIERNLQVCPKCNYHFRIGAAERLALVLDEGSFVEQDSDLEPLDPL
ncbi:MAG: acetyl-CoA carboxylase carboxyl transferase subunit beta, partial [Deltaproteobacteria bacterium]|nr:acetyl-CoA carboxylase carboxyl transferase subunit beta [Deltaproteobacteria bacterium]